MAADCLEHPQKTMLNLKFLLSVTVISPLNISKTIVYMNKIKLIQQAIELFQQWMKELKYSSEASK